MNFDNLSIVLVETTHPGNIGAAARAMKTMGFAHLILVKPALFPHAEALARAVGASNILSHARVVDTLDEAVSGYHLVIGTSARRRHVSCSDLNPRQCAAQVAALSEYTRIALVFGRERTGLTNEELDRCQQLVHIPTHPDYSSLNLAAAVQVLSYELWMTASAGSAAESSAAPCYSAPAEEMRRFYQHLEQVLCEIEFLDPLNPRNLMRRLRRLFNRALPDQNEINILRGILTAVQAWKRGSHD
jgi:tRNA (cytidine32/uridine32-2'-O)-methyltransferase